VITVAMAAPVECVNGYVGDATQVVVDPVARRVTQLVVREAGIAGIERVAPVDLVAEATPELVRLGCKQAAFAALPPFSEKACVRGEIPAAPAVAAAFLPFIPAEAPWIPLPTERIPPGELAVRRGMPVRASDGLAGQLDELVVDPANGEITHLVLGTGHALGRKEVTLPISAVDRVVDETIHLKLDRAAVMAAPAIPTIRRSHWPARTLVDMDIVVFGFDDSTTGHEALHTLLGSVATGAVEVVDAAMVVKEADGRAVADELTAIEARQGAFLGAIAGALAGLAAGPAGLLAAGGAAVGGAIGSLVDVGFSDENLAALARGGRAGAGHMAAGGRAPGAAR
jgi:uncharacterized membrane protein